ncbi:CDP-alcohol phosphatidyltransferase [Microbacterium jejuense]|uniref:CDP-alcohol phosphatidyltransferase n=1 Tax=Microbacterium jejuense TaxID=1263637 RepID=A0ABS7HHR7_9MICO|nr:CDP-alcohol phosphatidyltransferase [Microbacterium jejuense]MBW9092358.1 CDP-alcohol phosphatidyltransferase [Microbacterium jejuense]
MSTSAPREPGHRGRRVATALAIALLVALPALPGLVVSDATPLLRIPVESLVVVLLLAIVPWRMPRLVLAAAFGLFVTLALVLAGIDRGYEAALGIHFVPLDWPQLADAYGVVSDAVGEPLANLLVAAIVLPVAACAAGLAWASLRVARIVRGSADGRAVLAGTVAVWVAAAVVAPPLRTTDPVAAAASVSSVGTAVARTVTALQQQEAVARDIADDAFADVPAGRLLDSLRGKDVVVVFVESYGRVALEGDGIADGVGRVLDDGAAALAAEGYAARSAWLTSPTFGGRSWLAHATLQSGVWVDTQTAYEQVVASDRLTLTRAFADAGWHTVADVPSNTRVWDEGRSFYGYDAQLGANDVGYRGPRFGYARVPDQYTLKHFADTQLSGVHGPVMAEIDLVSSHTPWAPLPQLVPWDEVGDGSVYDAQPAQSQDASTVWQNPRTVQRYYGLSVEYSLGALVSFLQNVDDPDLVVLVLGDHQPASIVSGQVPTASALADDASSGASGRVGATSHDVPATVISRDPAVFAAIADWGWQDGLRPGEEAPVWRMDELRDRFFAAFAAER